jgi:uncharacterized DUF497 family protein
MALLPEFFADVTGFQWDAGNADKNWLRHRVTQAEAEQVFFNRPILVADDEGHSDAESRFFLLGLTDSGRFLSVVFTIRGSLVRVISARKMTRRERTHYGEVTNS